MFVKTQPVDARLQGELEQERLEEREAERKRLEIEQKEKAQLRHKAALKKERLNVVRCKVLQIWMRKNNDKIFVENSLIFVLTDSQSIN